MTEKNCFAKIDLPVPSKLTSQICQAAGVGAFLSGFRRFDWIKIKNKKVLDLTSKNPKFGPREGGVYYDPLLGFY